MSHPRVVTTTGAFRWNWSILVVFVFFCGGTILNIGYTNQVQHQSNKQNRTALAKSEQIWCGALLKILAPDAPPPATERAWEVYAGLVQIMRFYGCPNVPQIPPKPRPTVRPTAASPASSGARSGG